MKGDRLTQLRIRGMRVVESIDLDLRGLTVLIGDNGSGKSTILDALELLRQAAKPVLFTQDVIMRLHGGLDDLLRRGSDTLSLGVTVEGAGEPLDYDLVLGFSGTAAVVFEERLQGQTLVLHRQGQRCRVADREIDAPLTSLVLANLGLDAPPEVRRVLAALSGIDLQVAFETRPLWQLRELSEQRRGPRWPTYADEFEGVGRYGVNLALAFHELRNQGKDAWDEVVQRARLCLGDGLRDLQIKSRNGSLELQGLWGDKLDKAVSASSFSEGQIAYLLMLALTTLPRSRSVLGFDEPEVHLHPALVSSIVGMFEELAQQIPVVVATHSDRMLDALSDPATSVVLCDLDERRATCLRRPSKASLEAWLQDYRGIGSIRAEGLTEHVFAEAKS